MVGIVNIEKGHVRENIMNVYVDLSCLVIKAFIFAF